MMIIEKNDNRVLTFGLNHNEFRCKCDGCFATIIDPKLVMAYKRFRESADIPLKINSGYRCQYHNKEIGGVSASQHCIGSALDIVLNDLLLKYGSLEKLKLIAKLSGFTYTKVYVEKNFIHLDVRSKK